MPNLRIYKKDGKFICRCGCNLFIKLKRHHKYYGVPDYLPGHQFRGKKHTPEHIEKRIKPLRGKVLSASTRKKLSIALSGKTASAETRHKMSLRRKGVPKSPEHNRKNSEAHLGKFASEYTKQKISTTKKLKYPAKFQKEYEAALLNPPICACGCGNKITILIHHAYVGIPKYIHHHSPPVSCDTKPELLLQKAVKLNITNIFETQKKLYGRPDIFIEPKICIFVDGDYWHANPIKYKTGDVVRIARDKHIKAQQIWDKDKKITKYLETQGYTVLRFWEHEIYANVEDCIKRIKEKIKWQNYF